MPPTPTTTGTHIIQPPIVHPGFPIGTKVQIVKKYLGPKNIDGHRSCKRCKQTWVPSMDTYDGLITEVQRRRTNDIRTNYRVSADRWAFYYCEHWIKFIEDAPKKEAKPKPSIQKRFSDAQIKRLLSAEKRKCASQKLNGELEEKEKRLAIMKDEVIKIEKNIKQGLEDKKSFTAEGYFKRLKKQISTIQKLPVIKGVNIKDRVLSVYTHELVINYEGENIFLGEYEININTSTGNIRIDNLSGVSDSIFDHPHVEASKPCWGSIGSTVNDLTNRLELDTLISVIIEYLLTPLDEDGYCSFTDFEYYFEKY